MQIVVQPGTAARIASSFAASRADVPQDTAAWASAPWWSRAKRSQSYV